MILLSKCQKNFFFLEGVGLRFKYINRHTSSKFVILAMIFKREKVGGGGGGKRVWEWGGGGESVRVGGGGGRGDWDLNILKDIPAVAMMKV